MRLRALLLVAVFILLGLGVTLRTSEAQFDADTCPTIIEDMLSHVNGERGRATEGRTG